MGFGDFLKDVAKGAANSVTEKAKEMNGLKSEYQNKSDDELFRILESSGWSHNSSTEKIVAGSVLTNRGHGDRVKKYSQKN
ncbi:MAG: hypothetical protein NTW85_12650 [Methylococcales bacterium]|nr:hypothetical protein [Methylococcales bacterium]